MLTTTPAAVGDDIGASTSAASPPTCIVNVDEQILVLDFQASGEVDDLQIHALVTNAIRAEVQKSGVRLSPYRGWTIDERLTGGCTAPLELFHRSERLVDDAACMTRVARRLGTVGMLSGFVDPAPGGYAIDAQLVSNDDPTKARSIRFTFADFAGLPAAVRRAWATLSSVSASYPGATSARRVPCPSRG